MISRMFCECHAHGAPGIDLPARNRLNTSPHDFAEVGRLKRYEGDDGGCLCPVTAAPGSNCRKLAGTSRKNHRITIMTSGTERMPLT
jgi:hypothetical protein